MSTEFIRVPAKWILAGEHTVLRGGLAVAMPLSEFHLSLRWESSETFEVSPPGARPLVERMAKRAQAWSVRHQTPIAKLKGRWIVESTIPTGAGLGSSAALCAAFAQAMGEGLERSLVIDLAREMENEFHGKSSGLDVTTVLAAGPIEYRVGSPARPLAPGPLPRFRFFDTGLRASTKDCVEAVSGGWSSQEQADRAVQAMNRAAQEAEAGLALYAQGDQATGLARLSESMAASDALFEEWGLHTPETREARRRLLAEGALAVRLTGAGRGGFVVGLFH